MDIILFCICILEHSISNISSQFVHFFKAIAPCWWWAHRKYFTDLDVASPAHPLCGLRAYGTAPRFFKRHTTWLIMILDIRAHSVRFQLTVQIDTTDFYVFTKRWRFFYEAVLVYSASWRAFPTARSRRVELLVCRIWRTCALSPAFPSIYDFSMQCTSWRYQMNQKEQNRSQQGKEHTRQSWRFGTLICFLRVL